MRTGIGLFFLLLALSFEAIGQQYVDVARFSLGNVFNASYGPDRTTNVRHWDNSILYPIKIKEGTAILAGIEHRQRRLDLGQPTIGENANLIGTTLRLGLLQRFNENWSGTFIAMPRISSQNFHMDGNHFFMGGVAMLAYKYHARKKLSFGFYSTSERFGTLLTPLFGIYYLSPNEKFEINANLPVRADVNYRIKGDFRVGFAWVAIIDSYSLQQTLFAQGVAGQQQYVESVTLEGAPYIQQGFRDESILLRLQAGYSSVDYEVYDEGDVLPFRFSALRFGDDRLQQNANMAGGVHIRASLIYRYHLARTVAPR